MTSLKKYKNQHLMKVCKFVLRCVMAKKDGSRNCEKSLI